MPSKHALFLFAHQDDEFGVFAEIARLLEAGDRVSVVYLTSGALDGGPRPDRNAESLDVLGRLGVAASSVHFIGEKLGVPDSKLVEHMPAVLAELAALCHRIGQPELLYLLAWEGGHQDHDAAHLIGLALAKSSHCLPQTRQFTLYTGAGLSGPWFKLFAPLAANGEVMARRMSWTERLRFMRYCFLYPSQAKTWVGLFPFLFLHYVVRGTQLLQPCSLARIHEAAHDGPPLYERRGYCSQEDFFRAARPFIASSIGHVKELRP